MDNMLDALLQYSSDIILCLTTNFIITNLNTTAEKFFNWPREKTLGKNFLSLCKLYNYTCPIYINFFDNPILFNVNLDIVNSTGKQCNINWIISPLAQVDNHADGVIIIGKDIELKKNNIAYYLNGIINCIPGCLYWKDKNGYYLGCNELTATLAGLNSVYEIVGKTDQELWGNQAEHLIKNDKQVIATEETLLVEEELLAADGRWLYFTGVKMPLRDESDNIIGIIGNSLDITELKTMQAKLKEGKEQAEFANKAKSEFLACIGDDAKIETEKVLNLFKKKYRSRYYIEGKNGDAYLTKKEAVILAYIAKGKITKKVASILNISPRTVESHVENMKMKLHCHSKAELIEIFLKIGLNM